MINKNFHQKTMKMLITFTLIVNLHTHTHTINDNQI